MPATRFGPVVANRRIRALLLVGFLIRIPMFGVSVALTLHVVTYLHRTWAEAGLVAAVATLAMAISGPWRGALLDRIGLRRVVAPSIALTALCWSVAPFVGYWPLLMLAGLAGLFNVPVFTVMRQALVAATSDEQRRAALSLDSVIVEISFMIGPLLGVALASAFPTGWVIFGLEMTTALIAILLWLLNPPIKRAIDEEGRVDKDIPRREWMSPRFFAVCLVGLAAVVVLNGSDVAFVAAAREFGYPVLVGLIMSVWGLGSVIGGLIYGAMDRPPRLFTLLMLLAFSTLAIGAASNIYHLAIGAFVAGLFCAPTMTAAFEALTRVVDERVRGEASGWYGSFQTAGAALGGPASGWFIDGYGASGGFIAAGGVGLAAGLLGFLAIRARRWFRA